MKHMTLEETNATIPVINGASIIIAVPAALRKHTNAGLLLNVKRHGRAKLYEQLAETGPVATIKAKGRRTLALTRAPSAAFILKNTDIFQRPRGALIEFIEPVMGKGQATTNGAEHDYLRKQARSAFSTENLKKMTGHMVDVADGMISDFSLASQKGKPVDIGIAFANAAFEALNRGLWNVRDFSQGSKMQKAIGAIFDRADRRLTALLKLPAETLYALPVLPYRKAKRDLFAAAETLLSDREKQLQSPDFPHQDDLLSLLAKSVAKEELTRASAHQQIITYLIAGHETTAWTLTFAQKLLTEHPGVLEKMRAEVKTAIGDRAPTFVDMRNLPYTAAIFKEVLRLYPAVAAIPREATKDTYVPVGNDQMVKVAKGQVVITTPWTLHRDPENWKDAQDVPNPLDFSPERWLVPGFKPKEGSYVPFAMGSYTCIGARMAEMEFVTFMARFAQKGVKLSVIDPEKVEPVVAMTLRSKNPVMRNDQLAHG